MPGLARSILTALCVGGLCCAGCQLPVTPLVTFTPYQTPLYTQKDFERQFASWKAGRPVTWEVQFKGTAFSESELVVRSNVPSSYGARLPGQASREFTPTPEELSVVVNKLLAVKLFDLYDGHYGALTQAGGVGGPDIEIRVGGLLKHVSKDEDLQFGWEAAAIKSAADVMVALGLKYIKR